MRQAPVKIKVYMDLKIDIHTKLHEIYKNIFISHHQIHLYYLFLPILIRQNKITLECGIARTNGLFLKCKIIKQTIGRNNV